MNRRRDQPRTPAFVIFSIVLAACIVTSGGVMHAYYKNRQVQLSREIDATERRIGECRKDISTIVMRKDELLNRFAIRKQLEENGSDLRPIPLSVVEEIDPAPSQHPSMASAAP